MCIRDRLRPLPAQPAIEGAQHSLGGMPHRPGIRRGKVIVEEVFDCVLGGKASELAGTHPIGDGERRAFQSERFAFRDERTVKVFIGRFDAPVGKLALSLIHI